MPKYTAERIEEIRGHLSDLASRGISVKEFARELGVAAWTIHTWRHRFGDGPRPDEAPPRPADLIEVTPAASAGSIEIEIGDTTVRVVAPVDAADLAQVLRAVRAC